MTEVLIVYFFFKQKTAYEMRISDWSSDVCSSDLHPVDRRLLSVTGPSDAAERVGGHIIVERQVGGHMLADRHRDRAARRRRDDALDARAVGQARREQGMLAADPLVAERRNLPREPREQRSEEHTSELQALMRISYAVLCLK